LLAKQLRQTRRLIAFLGALSLGLWRHRRLPHDASRLQCAQWLHEICGGVLHAIGAGLSVEGKMPAGGLVVSNHLSYLDIVCYSATMPCAFVSKAEVAEWPIFGRYARMSGTVFVQRHDRADALRANLDISKGLEDGVPVVLFPEGTTTDGRHVLPFHSTTLQPAINAGVPVTPCAIHYELEDGDVAREICWWGGMRLEPHVWNLLGKKSLRAKIVFGDPIEAGVDRKQLGEILHREVIKLRRQERPQGQPAQAGLRKEEEVEI
jgi:lyso-ornithine lipid O-acyltransferase